MFYKDSGQIYRVTELDALPWLVHGFGTRLARVPTLFGNLATLRQIHSTACVVAAGRGGVLGEGDALLENTPGSVVAVKTADCLPILLVDERHQAVAAVHAGWRGTVAGIARRAVRCFGGAGVHAAAPVNAPWLASDWKSLSPSAEPVSAWEPSGENAAAWTAA